MGVDAILDDILARCGLRRPDGRPLYGYRATRAHLLELAPLLKREAARRRPFDSRTAAAFSLFVAEAFCRLHADGPWTWQTVLGPLGYSRGHDDLCEDLIRGLTFWQRTVIRSKQREFLITIACEGGLPWKLLKANESSLKDYLSALVRLIEQDPRTDLLDLCRRESERLPASYRLEAVFQLAHQLLHVISDLRAKVAGRADPAGVLDREDPGWRRRLPIRMHSDTAIELIRGLLETPSHGAERVFEIRTLLVMANSPRVVRELNLPSLLEPTQLASAFGLDAADLPLRAQVNICWGGVRRPVAIVSHAVEQGAYKVESLVDGSVSHPEAFSHQLELSLTLSGAREIKRIVASGGQPLTRSVPWIFAESGSQTRHHLLGVGSARTRKPSALVLAPKGSQMEASPQGAWTVAGILPDGREVLRVAGGRVALALSSGERFDIITAGERDDSHVIYLAGRTDSLGVSGASVWIGMPKVMSSAPSRQPLRTEWRSAGAAGAWSPTIERCQGDVVIRALIGDSQVFRRRVTVLPSDFEIRLEPARRGGRVRLRSASLLSASAEATEGSILATCQKEGPFHTVEVRAAAKTAPARLQLRVFLVHGGEATLEVPFPAVQTRFTRNTGSALDRGEEIPLYALSEVKAEALDADPRAAYDLLSNGRWLARLCADAERPARFSLPLEHIRDQVSQLLASLDPDATLKLEIRGAGAQLEPPARLHVRLHDLRLNRTASEDGRSLINLDARCGQASDHDRASGLRLEARPIMQPASLPIEVARLKGTEPNWALDESTLGTGAWLITGWEGERCVVRPFCVNVGAGDAAPRDRLETAATLPTKEERQREFNRLLDEMTADHGHVGWVKLAEIGAALERLPANTFEIMRCVARNSLAAVMLLYCAPDHLFGPIYRAVERLPFSWLLVPPTSWLTAARRLQASVTETSKALMAVGLDIDDLIERRLDRFCLQLRRYHPAAPLLGGLIARTIPGLMVPSDSIKAATGADRTRFWHRWNELRGKVVTRYADLRWPHGRCLAQRKDQVPGLRKCAESQPEYQFDLLSAPYLAAWMSVNEAAPNDEELLDLRLMCSFDEDWFHGSYALALRYLISERLVSDPRWLDVQSL